MPGMGAACTRRGTIGRPGTRMFDRGGPTADGRPLPAGPPILGRSSPGGRIGRIGRAGRTGRTGTPGRMTRFGGREGCGAPGTADGLVLAGGRAAGGLGRLTDGLGRATGGRGLATA